jgi:hypothetical protein
LNNEDYVPFYRYQHGKQLCTSIYEPLINSQKTVVAMNWTHESELYCNPAYNKEICTQLFNKELEYFARIKHKPYAPEFKSVVGQTIYIKWHDRGLSEMIYNNTISGVVDWKDKVKAVVADLEKEGLYKINLYPTTFYFDNNDNIRILDLFGFIDSTRFIPSTIIDAITGGERKQRFADVKVNNMYDGIQLYQNTKKSNYGNWPGDFLND